MAFKNLYNANLATGTDFGRMVTDIVSYNGGVPNSVTEKSYRGNRSYRIDTLGIVPTEGGAHVCPPMTIGEVYTDSRWIWLENGVSLAYISAPFAAGVNASKILYGSGAWQKVFLSWIATGTDRIRMYTRKQEAISFYIDLPQLELGPTATSWEFPGIDLTGNSIPSNTVINNVKLENIIRAFGIASTEQVNNLTLQNILTLTGIPSEEYVNNIELLNEIILEAVENTTSVKDLITYIIREIIYYTVSLNKKEEYNTILTKKEEYTVKV